MNEQNYEILPSTEEEISYINNGIEAFNHKQQAFTQEPVFIHKNFSLKIDGKIVAGITGLIYCWKILYVDVLYVDENHRRKNIGGILLDYMEEEGRKMACKIVHLDTFDFQAKDFYLKRGYQIFGVLEDCPEGHKRYYLQKYL